MLEILQFVFSSFWIWLGTAVIIALILMNIRVMVSAYFSAKSAKYLNQGVEQQTQFLSALQELAQEIENQKVKASSEPEKINVTPMYDSKSTTVYKNSKPVGNKPTSKK